MNDILMWAGIILFGGFFFVLMVYSFYLILFSKHNATTPEQSKKMIHDTPHGERRIKFIGRT